MLFSLQFLSLLLRLGNFCYFAAYLILKSFEKRRRRLEPFDALLLLQQRKPVRPSTRLFELLHRRFLAVLIPQPGPQFLHQFFSFFLFLRSTSLLQSRTLLLNLLRGQESRVADRRRDDFLDSDRRRVGNNFDLFFGLRTIQYQSIYVFPSIPFPLYKPVWEWSDNSKGRPISRRDASLTFGLPRVRGFPFPPSFPKARVIYITNTTSLFD